MRGRGFCRRNVLMAGEEVGLFLGSDVQHVHAFAGLARQRDQALRAYQRRGRIAPDWMRARIAFHAQIHPFAQPILVLGMEGGAAADALSTARTPSSSSISSEPVEEPMNTFTPQTPGSTFQFAQVLGVLARGADIEGKVAMHAVMRRA